MGKRGEYKRIAERTAGGNYELLDPFDYLILAQLPEKGTLMGGYYPIGTSVRELHTRHFKEVTAAAITSRLRTMESQSLTCQVGAGVNKGWQRTSSGKEVYEKWQTSKKQS